MSSKYVELATVATGYAKRMNRLSARIFGEPTRPTKPRNMKIVQLFSEKPVNKRPEIVDYYPRVPEIGWMMYNLREYGLFRDEHRDFNEEIERTRILRGKKPRVGFKNLKKKNQEPEKN
ncbi:hypothetical protein HCN44_008126 [Aphidius gifuensis]|uniref:Small ribosomal subunit protein mS33 n=1 Tax=Aphidius gifuensis TaxID=684658 RepID=A0A834XPV5_APHGI|nr:28S ribosomal protein S33, mitochondrial [Aphidius gifuensis]XP_044016154.1 28S ribosomal protein S33, mitochondrial [Aphidius gifuensis]KAF7989452.1 hypothetical protein HCN44_008126 [Aphidius gifuensis]